MSEKNEGEERVLLFRKDQPQQEVSGIRWISMFSNNEGEAWKDDEKPEGEKPEHLSFVAEIKTPQELIKIVGKDPMGKYVLFRGRMVDVKVEMPVFVGGLNIARSNEWI